LSHSISPTFFFWISFPLQCLSLFLIGRKSTVVFNLLSPKLVLTST
jgi:hypothetical protein